MKPQILCRLLASFALVGCAGLPQADRQPEVAREHGYFVSGHEASARGGVGGYVPRMNTLSHARPEKSAIAISKTVDDSLKLAAAAPAHPAFRLAAPKVFFGSGSAKLTVEAKKELRAFARDAFVNGTEIQVHGYADAMGSNDLNHKLAQSRALNVAAFLRKQTRLSSTEMKAEGQGVDAAAPVGKRAPASRRVDIVTQSRP